MNGEEIQELEKKPRDNVNVMNVIWNEKKVIMHTKLIYYNS